MPNNSKMSGFVDVDPRKPQHGWLVVSMVMVLNMTTLIIYASFPVLYQPLMDKYGASRGEIGWSITIHGIVAAIGGILCAPFINHYGSRLVAVTGLALRACGYFLAAQASSLHTFHIYFGVILGLGNGASRIAANCVIQQSFTARRDLMTRVASLGYYIGEAVGPLVASSTIRLHGLEASLSVMGVLQAAAVIFVMFFPKHKISAKASKSKCELFGELLDVSLLRDYHFLCFCALRFTWAACKWTLLTHIVNAAHMIGVTGERADNLPAFVAITALGFGAVNVILVRWLEPMVGFIIGMVCVSVGCFLVAIGTYPLLVASMILLGCDEGVSFPSLVILLYEGFGDENFARALSLTDTAHIPACFISGSLAGMLVDYLDNYTAVFIAGGMLGLTSILIAALAHSLGKRKQQKLDEEMLDRSKS